MAIQNDLQNAELGYILCPFESYTNINGKPLVGGWISLYEAGTDTKYISYQDWLGNLNPFKIPIPADGRVVALGDPTKTYDAYLYNSFGDLVCSRLNVQANVPGNISISGADTRINNTDGTLDVSLRTLGNNVRQYTINTHNKVLDVQDPLYFVENSNTATVIGFSGDSSSSISGKMDESKLEYNNIGEISAYNGSAFAGGQGGGAGDPAVNDLVHSNSATWNNVSAKLDTTAFSTVSGNFLTAIPDDYSTKDYVQSSVSSKLDSTAFSTVSGDFLTAHQDISQYAKTEDLTAYQEKGDYYSASNPSGFLTKSSADTLYQLTGDYAAATALDGKVDTSSFTAFSSTTNEKIEYISGALSGTYELSAGEGIDITDYPNEQKTVISVTAQGGSEIPTAISGYWQSASDTVCANSGAWGGSALPVSAGKGVKISLQNDTLVFSNDETVLWSGSALNAVTTEDPNNFEQLRVYVKNTDTLEISTFTVDSSNTQFGLCAFGGFAAGVQIFGLIRSIITTSGLSISDAKTNKIPYTDGSNKTIIVESGGWVYTKVIGINRIAGGN